MAANRRVFAIPLLLFLAAGAGAIDFWQYPEAADKGSIFASCFAAALEISSPGLDGLDFSFSRPELCVDYVLPIGLPFALGLSLGPFEDSSFGVGIRPAYYANLDLDWLGLYFSYPVSIVFSEEAWIVKHGFGLGVRARIKDFFSLGAEIRPQFAGLLFAASFKLN